MVYYLTTEEEDEKNQLFRKHLQKLKSNMAEYLRAGLPASMQTDETVGQYLRDLETRTVMVLMDKGEDVYPPMLFCGMNWRGIRWSKFIGLPHGKRLVVIDEDGNKYSFDEFKALAGETCVLTAKDEKVLATIRASQDEPELDTCRLYMPETES
ncbi:MAG: hypothetical protein IJ708_16405 [Clostridia bacterium]|nr:hypothetical protein [Clostridia bacterium]